MLASGIGVHVKPSALLVLGLAFAIAGCSGNSNASNQAASQDTNAAAPAESSAPAAQTAALPVYPGATKSTVMGTMNQSRCGHKESVVTYTVNADPKTVLAWYAQRMPGGIQIDAARAFGGTHIMTSNEIFAPDGSSAAGISQPNAAAMGLKTAPVYIGLGTYDPPLSPDELHTMQDITGTDPAAKQKAIAAMKAKCGPASVKGLSN
jgi:hypothetical protein